MTISLPRNEFLTLCTYLMTRGGETIVTIHEWSSLMTFNLGLLSISTASKEQVTVTKKNNARPCWEVQGEWTVESLALDTRPLIHATPYVSHVFYCTPLCGMENFESQDLAFKTLKSTHKPTWTLSLAQLVNLHIKACMYLKLELK